MFPKREFCFQEGSEEAFTRKQNTKAASQHFSRKIKRERVSKAKGLKHLSELGENSETSRNEN